MVLPVPGLPVNTRWWLVSIVGMPRSWRSCWMRSRLDSRRMSAFTSSRPTRASSCGQELLDRPRRWQLGRRLGGDARGGRGARRRRPPSRRTPGRAGRDGRRRRRRRRAAARRGSGRWRRSRRATARGRSPRRRGRGARRRRSSAPPAPCRRERRHGRAGRTGCSGGRATPVRLRSSSLSRSCGGRHPHRRLEPCADVVEPRLQLVGRLAFVGADHGGHDVAGLDGDVVAVIAARELAQLGVDAVDERVDVAGEDPGHGAGAYVRRASLRASDRSSSVSPV